MVNLNPFDILMWTFRRNEHDIVNMYDSLSPMMQITTKGDMLNFGYWDNHSLTPLSAQNRLCELVGELAELKTTKTLSPKRNDISEYMEHLFTMFVQF